MKTLTKTLALAICFFALSCEPAATFTEPQPADVKNLANLPNHLQGKYVNTASGDTLTITDKLIELYSNGFIKINKNELDSLEMLEGNTIVNLKTKEKILVKLDGDSLIVPFHQTDTIFKLNYDNVARKYKGYYFINTRYPENRWEVKKLQLAKGKLIIGNITAKKDIDRLKQVAITAQDTVPYQFTTDKKGFKKFIKAGGFKTADTFLLVEKQLRKLNKSAQKL